MITISKETTYLTEPRRNDGWIDFAAVLNEQRMIGVTPENNAAVPFWQAVGPQPIASERRAKFFELLGIETLPDDGTYLVPFLGFLARKSGNESIDLANVTPLELAACKEFDIAEARPWSRDEFPALAEWVDLNRKPLAKLRRVVHRTRFFEPTVVLENNSLCDTLGDLYSHQRRDAMNLLRLCAMLSLAEGRMEDAWQDLMACHQLARIEASRALGLNVITGRGFEKMSCYGVVKFLHNAKLTRGELKACRERFLANSKLPSVESCFLGERLYGIDAARDESKGRFKGRAMSMLDYERFYGENAAIEASKSQFKRDLLADPRVDWNLVLRLLNSKCDEANAACREPNWLSRLQALDKLQMDANSSVEYYFEHAFSGRIATLESKAFSEIVTGLLFNPSFSTYARQDMDCTTTVQMTVFAFALAEYHADHAAYPGSLSELVPDYLSIIPSDPFSNLDYIYRIQGNGYLLCSVAPKGLDESGFFGMDEYYTGDLVEYLSEVNPCVQRDRIESRIQGAVL